MEQETLLEEQIEQNQVEETEQVEQTQPILVRGEPFTALPEDLYIPPEALQVFLEAFSGPLDLLLYLIKRNNLDILDIPIAEITRQYMEYVEIMKELHLDLAAEYLVMAAMLAEIKSRMLLPRPTEVEEEADPRAELVRRLQEYEQFKLAAQSLDALPRLERDYYAASVEPPVNKVATEPTVSLQEILFALKDVMQRAEMFTKHAIKREPLTVRERMAKLLEILNTETFTPFMELFDITEGRSGVVVTFLAILELTRESLLVLVQSEPFAPIHVKLA